ncbi:hypothetical protein OESDEN_20342 [Oesophagostomum dentatum]|uniref:Uncharacterized protein n=1 Tax=Oesophagostomum dentatum TaxID=61180 RepID=A0A0B1S8Y1_OESDE|nr:hypothetical protein OESDEN_20342 [Oesophagostomum dentatum]
MVATNHVKESAVRCLVAIGNRGKKKSSLDANALRLLTVLVNTLASETLLRAAQNAQRNERPLVTTADFQRILPGILLDFST